MRLGDQSGAADHCPRGWIVRQNKHVNLDPLIAVPIAVACRALGMRLRGDRAAPCPSCGSRDPRAVQIYRDGWYCHRCDTGGPDSKWLIWVAAGGRSTDPREVADLAMSVGLMTPDEAYTPRGEYTPPEAPPPSRAVRDRHPAPREEVARLIRWSSAVGEETGCDSAAWLAGRGLPVPSDPRMARALWCRGELGERLAIEEVEWPGWAVGRGRSGPWCGEGYGLLGVAYGAAGRVGGLRARWVGDADPPRGVKEISPRGHTVRGMVYADEGGRQILRGDLATPGALVIVEGLPDLIAMAEAAAAVGTSTTGCPRVGVWGMWSGSVQPEICETVPRGTVVYVATDDDVGGWTYAAQWADGLDGHDVRRLVPPAGGDWADAREASGTALPLRDLCRTAARYSASEAVSRRVELESRRNL